jgi:predicted nucleic acid-binding Zn ribbon protein
MTEEQRSGPPVRSGLDVAREALAAARADARRRGVGARGTAGRAATGRVNHVARADAAAAARRSGPGPDDRDPQPIGRSISRLLAERGWETDVAVGGVVGRWDEIVGADMAAHCRPDGFDAGVLTVRTDTTAWATQLRLLAPALVRRLNEEVGRGTVSRVVVRGPAGPSWRKGALSVRGRGPRDTYG